MRELFQTLAFPFVSSLHRWLHFLVLFSHCLVFLLHNTRTHVFLYVGKWKSAAFERTTNDRAATLIPYIYPNHIDANPWWHINESAGWSPAHHLRLAGLNSPGNFRTFFLQLGLLIKRAHISPWPRAPEWRWQAKMSQTRPGHWQLIFVAFWLCSEVHLAARRDAGV